MCCMVLYQALLKIPERCDRVFLTNDVDNLSVEEFSGICYD